jgi:hypothetical protein
LPCLASNHSLQGSVVKQKRVKTSPTVYAPTTPLVQSRPPFIQPAPTSIEKIQVIDLCISEEEEVNDTEDEDDVAAFVPFHEARGARAEWGVDALERAADGNAEDPIEINGDEESDTNDDDENEVCCKCI